MTPSDDPDDVVLATTREKLREVTDHYQARLREPSTDPHVRELSLQSLKRLINRLTEELARLEARQRQAVE